MPRRQRLLLAQPRRPPPEIHQPRQGQPADQVLDERTLPPEPRLRGLDHFSGRKQPRKLRLRADGGDAHGVVSRRAAPVAADQGERARLRDSHGEPQARGRSSPRRDGVVHGRLRHGDRRVLRFGLCPRPRGLRPRQVVPGLHAPARRRLLHRRALGDPEPDGQPLRRFVEPRHRLLVEPQGRRLHRRPQRHAPRVRPFDLSAPRHGRLPGRARRPQGRRRRRRMGRRRPRPLLRRRPGSHRRPAQRGRHLLAPHRSQQALPHPRKEARRGRRKLSPVRQRR
mmetsp:Transcript_13679/g.44606  ORF Transcript_13679/g.44606 Transcript_13679/m.44606 type:complete len:282 (-) Transcript_13679:1476-2321(-)